jgi:hypothetical protein
MYIKDGIAYAENPRPPVRIIHLESMDMYRLKVQFSNGEIKMYDCAPLLAGPVFKPLQDTTVFKNVYLSHGAPCWLDGQIDIDPESLYEEGIPL